MSDADIDAMIDRLREAIVNDDAAAGQRVAFELLGDFLKNVRRIAEALEEAASN